LEEVLVSTDDDADLAAVVEALRQAGLSVTEVLTEVGVVIGTADSDKLASLSAVPGVAEVEPQRTIQLPPPDSPVQ
jgi:hypothetical protein